MGAKVGKRFIPPYVTSDNFELKNEKLVLFINNIAKAIQGTSMITENNFNIKSLSIMQKTVLVLIFSAFAFIGLYIAADYGVAWDDHLQTDVGKQNLEFALGKSNDIFENADRFYGSAFELPIYAVQQLFDSFSKQVLVRHLITHFYFISALFVFFILLLKLFKSFPLAIIGILFIYLSPRMFAHSFFNTKDIPFVSTLMISLYTLWQLAEKPKSTKRIVTHAFFSAFLIDIRLIGFLMPAITFGHIILIYLSKSSFKGVWKPLINYSVLMAAFVYFLWPALWPDPKLLAEGFLRMSHFPWRYTNLIAGETVLATENPWYYIPLWIGISAPLVLIISYLIGAFYLIRDFFKNMSLLENPRQMTIFVFALIPIDLWILFLIIKPTFYDGWRHLYFFIPFLAIGAVYGVQNIISIGKNKKTSIIVIVLLVILAVDPIYKIVKLHPYQQVYFNALVSKEKASVRNNWEMDYWGLSFYEGFEKLLEIDDSPNIKVIISNISGIDNWKLTNEIDPRIELVEKIEDADYFISNYRFHAEEYPYEKIISIDRQGSCILGVYRIEGSQELERIVRDCKEL